MSTSAAVRDAFNHLTVVEAVGWAERILTYDGAVLNTSTKRTNYLASLLHQYTDGYELREAANVPASCMVDWLECGDIINGLRSVSSVTHKRPLHKSSYF